MRTLFSFRLESGSKGRWCPGFLVYANIRRCPAYHCSHIRGQVVDLPAATILETGMALTIIISPLRALQQDQVMQLTEHDVKAAWLNSDLKKSERRAVLENHGACGHCCRCEGSETKR